MSTTFEADLIDAPAGPATLDAVIVGVAMMSEQEAHEAIGLMGADIEMSDHYADSFRRRVLDFAEREGWRVLGYKGVAGALRAELGTTYSSSYLSRLLQAAEIERVLELPIGNSTPESVLREVAKAPTPETQRAAYHAATADGPATAKKAKAAVTEITAPELPPEFAIIQRRYEKHGYALASHVQGDHRVYVTRKEGMTGIVTFDWENVLSKLDRLEQQASAISETQSPTPVAHAAPLLDSAAPVGDPLPPALLALALRDLDALLSKDLEQAGYYWHSAVPCVIALNGSNWRGDAPTAERAIELARLHKDAKGEPITVFPALNPMECKALIREAKVFIESGTDRKLPTIGKLLRIAARMALEATE